MLKALPENDFAHVPTAIDGLIHKILDFILHVKEKRETFFLEIA
jgi:hypothetical protein